MIFADISDAGWMAIGTMFTGLLTFLTVLISEAIRRRDATKKDEALTTISTQIADDHSKVINVTTDLKREVVKAAEETAVKDIRRTEQNEERDRLLTKIDHKVDTAAEKTKQVETKVDIVVKAVNGPTDKKHTEVMTDNAKIIQQNEEIIRIMGSFESDLRELRGKAVASDPCK